MTQNLQTLPTPNVVEDIGFEVILDSHRADLLTRYPEAAPVIALESEPLTKLLQAHAWREMLYRQRVNDAARAHLLAFAQGADLDHKGDFYGVARLQGEDDARYRLRIQLRVQALSGQGTAQHYEHIAMTASLQVRAARAVQTWPGSVQILLWVHENADAAQAVQAVQTALQEPGACTLGVELSVALAKPRPIDITANLRREANAPADTVERIKATLAEKLQGYAQLGRAVPRSWISTCLHVSGIAQVTYPDASAPAEVTTLQPDEYPMLGTLQLRDDGVPA